MYNWLGGNGGGKVVVRIREGVAVAMLDCSGPQVNVVPLLGEWCAPATLLIHRLRSD